jgi:hypothetical protein
MSEKPKVPLWMDAGMCLSSIQAIVAMYGEQPTDYRIAARLAAWKRTLAQIQRQPRGSNA